MLRYYTILVHACFVAITTDHIDYIKNIAGIDYVGIGSDFDGIPVYVCCV